MRFELDLTQQDYEEYKEMIDNANDFFHDCIALYAISIISISSLIWHLVR